MKSFAKIHNTRHKDRTELGGTVGQRRQKAELKRDGDSQCLERRDFVCKKGVECGNGFGTSAVSIASSLTIQC